MDYLPSSSSSSMLCPLYSQEDEILQFLACNNSPTQLQPHDHDQINPTQHHNHDDQHHDLGLDLDLDLDHLLNQIQDVETNNNDDDQQRRKASLLGVEHDDDDDDDEREKNNPNDKKKRQKIIHREIERQRRLEMTSLHANLRNLLPLDFVKGKRSMSDHLDQSIKYIKYMEQKIKGLSDKRDALKLEVPNTSTKVKAKAIRADHEVRVNLCQGGVEVIVCTCNCDVGVDDHQGFLLSRILQCLTKQGLDVVSCISHKVNNKLVHSIQAQVGDGRSFAIDAVQLQQKLAAI